MRPTVLRTLILATVTVVIAACGDANIDSTGVSPNASTAIDPANAPTLERAPGVVLAAFDGYIDPATGEIEITMIAPTEEQLELQRTHSEIGTAEQAVWCALVPYADGVAGSGPDSTVELVTEPGTVFIDLGGATSNCEAAGDALYGAGVIDTSAYAILGVLCANVTMRSFYDVSFVNTYAEITEHRGTVGQHGYNGVPVAEGGNGGTGAEPPGYGRFYPNNENGGLWYYNVLGPVSTDPDNSGTQQWTFQMLDTTPFTFTGVVRTEIAEICGNELDDDCDGVVDNNCEVFEADTGCYEDLDCEGLYCEGAVLAEDIPGVCAEASCDDGVQNGLEEGVDCGGDCGMCIGGDCAGTPGNLVCTYSGGDVAIPDNGYDGNLTSMACVNIEVPATGLDNIDSVTVELDASHTWVGDLTVTVTAPGGDNLNMMSRPGTNSAGTLGFGYSADLIGGFANTFDEGSSNDAEAMGVSGADVCAGDGICDYFPNPDETVTGTLVDLTGTNLAGNWSVCVGDSAGADTGSVHGATLTIASSEGPATVDVSIESMAFNPADVNINVGDTVRWTNNDSMDHTATTGECDFEAGCVIFDSGILGPGDSYSLTFPDALTQNYICTIHPTMVGNVIVSE